MDVIYLYTNSIVLILFFFHIAYAEDELWTLRLVGGSTPFEGTPEVFIDDYNPICDEYITPAVAMVICRGLGLPPLNVTMKNGAFADTTDSLFQCTGDEEFLMSECGWAVYPEDRPCISTQGIVCNGNVRLVRGTTRFQGNVQIYRQGELTGICDHKADLTTAKVICGQLGYEIDSAVLYTGSYYGPGLNSSHYIECEGNETSHEQCMYTPAPNTTDCGEENNIGVDCNGTMLYYFLYTDISDEGASLLGYKRVDVEYNLHFGSWCDDLEMASERELNNIMNMASVICASSGLSRYNPSLKSVPSGTWYDLYTFFVSSKDVMCTGEEDDLSNCIRGGSFFKGGKCNHKKEVAIKCNDYLHLADGDSDSNGRVEFKAEKDGTWRALQVVGPDPALAIVLCFELGFENTMAALRLGDLYGKSETEVWPFIYTCAGTENSMGACQIRKPAINETTYLNVGVECDATPIKVYSFNRDVLELTIGADTMYACAAANVTIDTYTTGVLCHTLGYSRFQSSYTLTPLVESGVNVTDVVSRARCRGTESDLAQCAMDTGLNPSSHCDMALVLNCADSPCATAPFKPKKTIKCYNSYCATEKCAVQNDYRVCSLENGQSCGLTKSFQKFGKRLILIHTIAFCDVCKGEYHEDNSVQRTTMCCYQDFCNYADTTVLRSEERARILNGTVPSEGRIEFRHATYGWSFLHLDERPVPQSFLKMLCWEVGYANSSVALIHDDPNAVTGQNVLTLDDYNFCGTLGGDSCPVRKMGKSGPIMTVNCDARSPPMRLVDGLSSNAGRLEVYYNKTWGTVCSKEFTDGSADIICRTLGFPGGCSVSSSKQRQRANFRSGQNGITFSKLRCNGDEENIWFCDHRFFVYEERDCTHEDDVGVVCDDGAIATEWYNSDEENAMIISTEQPTNQPQPSPSLDQQIKDKVVTCMEGSCITDGCNSSQVISYCNITNGGSCYTEKRRGYTSGDTSFRFGCINTCTTGITKRSGAEIITFCCTRSMCNANVTVAIEDFSPEVSNVTDVFKNTGNKIHVSVNMFLIISIVFFNYFGSNIVICKLL